MGAFRLACFLVTATWPSLILAVSFNRDVRPILSARCFKCHGPGERQGGLRLDRREFALALADSGRRAVVPGDVNASELLRRVQSDEEGHRMPAEEEPLSKAEIATLRAWVREGAPWQEHWSFVKPVRPTVPPVGGDWVVNAVDSFVLARLKADGMSPSGRASREKLFRRLYLDLVGLPPSVDEVDAFLADSRRDAYERLVDRLLASPRFGERWARPWLDAARYGDSNGYQRDNRREIWAYRDWVVSAFNRDLPFDQFTIEQIAGDLLPGAAADQVTATGFNRNTLVNIEAGTDPEEERNIAIVDRVNTTCTVWLGLTMECAQCHDHKYEPFSQKDYYRLFAFFNNTREEIKSVGSRRDFVGPKMSLPLAGEKQAERGAVQSEVALLKKKLDRQTRLARTGQRAWEQRLATTDGPAAGQLSDEIRKILAVAAAKRSAKQKQRLDKFYLDGLPAIKLARRRLAAAETRLKKLTPPTTLVMREREQPRMTHVLQRGDFLKPGERVEAGLPEVLSPKSNSSSTVNRLDLARWLVHRDNPLTARVAVNRYWQEIFGRGLVDSPEDFGAQGVAPTHPKLLDWLAVQFMDSGWSTKRLLRLLVTSATYRQDSRVTPELLRIDPANKLYARGPRFRLPAEAVRDNALAVSGLLSAKVGGPPVFPYQPPGVWNHIGVTNNNWVNSRGEDQYRRGLYVYWRRTVPYPSLVNFDAPSREACVVRRSRSNTPLQALTLMNDPVFVEAAGALATRIMRESPTASPAGRITHAFRLALARPPNEREQSILLDCYQQERAHYQSDKSAARKLTAKWCTLATADAAEFAAWLHVSTVLLNLDEVITK